MEYRVLGPLEIREGSKSLPLGSAKQRALLALLLLNANRVVSRDRLIDALWDEDPPEHVVTALQVYVSRLRKLLPAGVLVTQAPGYLLRLAPGELDLERFHRLRAEGRLHEALALWQGTPLAEFDEPFAHTESGRLEDLRLATLEERIDADLAAARHAELVGELTALVAEHPNRERLRAQLMLALYRSGRHADALAAYRDARAALDAIGLEPSAALRELEKAILVQDSALAAPPQLLEITSPLPGPLRAKSPFPLVGRSRELELLRTRLLLAEAGEGGQVAIIGGEAGGGKTRLARELAHEAAERGTLVLYGTSDAVVSTPYQPFVEALGFLTRVSEPQALDAYLGSGRGELARLLPELGPSPAPSADDPDTSRRRLHSAVIDLLIRIGRHRPLLVVLDDLHWADAPSIQLLRQLVQAAPEARMLVLLTFRDRSEDVSPELTSALANLSRLEGVTRIALHALGDNDIAEFIEQTAGSPAPSHLTETISKLTEGTPFLICELWRSLLDAGTIEIAEDGVTLARSFAELTSPESVRDVVRYRLSRLTGPTAAMLEVASVAGTEFELSLLGDEHALVGAAEEAIESGLIEPVSEPGVAHRFSHELVRRALYERLTSVRRAELHLRVGEALERKHADNLDRVVHDLAHHFRIAAALDGTDRAIHYNVRAAEAAIRSLAFDDATRMFAAALDLGVADDRRRARIQLDLGTALIQAGRVEEAEARLADAIRDALRAEDDGLHSHAAIVRSHARLRIDAAAGSDETRTVAEKAIDTFTRLGDEDGLAQAWRLVARATAREGAWGAATEALEVAIEHARNAVERRGFQSIVGNLIAGLYYGPTPALDAIDRCEALLAEYGDDRYIDAIAACGLAGLLGMTGRFDDARAAGTRGIALLDELNVPVTAGHMRAYVADAALVSGDAAAAERELTTGYGLLENAGDHAGTVSTAYDLAWFLCLQGRYADAEEWAVKGRDALDACDVMTRVFGLASEAELAAHAGRMSAAASLAHRATEVADGMDAPNVAAAAYVSSSRVLTLAGLSEEANAARATAVGLYQAKGNVAAPTQLLASFGSAIGGT
jgi:DNA-binding SARP family transcriptional activator